MPPRYNAAVSSVRGNKLAAFDEMRDPSGALRPAYQNLDTWLSATPKEEFNRFRSEADLLFRRLGITFTVYGSGTTERLIPFDIIPRVLAAAEWAHLRVGLEQRVRAMNLFLADVYQDREIIRAGIIPADLVLANKAFRPEAAGVIPPRGTYVHVAGIDIVRTGENDFYVLEDNLRTPSGVSYMLENRVVMMRLFPELFAQNHIAPVDHYPEELLNTLRAVSPNADPTVVVLTPGPENSAYFEHTFLAEQMGIELVEGQDLFVANGFVYMRTPAGPQRVDVIYRRVDDDFLDPLALRQDSLLGVPGLLSVYHSGRVALANAIGTGVADDKAVYAFVPDIMRFYLREEPILKNVPTYLCRRPDDLKYVLANLPELVVKEVHGSGGYGMLIGPAATKAQIAEFRQRLTAAPEGYIAQPTLALSTCPTFVKRGIAPRHVDLRPFVLTSDQVRVVPGGLTRVALEKGSLVVNSSQGGGTKDAWVLEA